MVRSNNTDFIFDTHVNGYLEQYKIVHNLYEAVKDDDDDEDTGFDSEDEDDYEDVGYYSDSDTKTLTAPISSVETKTSTESDEVKYTSKYPEPLSPEEERELFVKIEKSELYILKLLSRVKFSAEKITQIFNNLISGKIPLSKVKHKRELAAYRRWSSGEDYVRYVQNNLSTLTSLFEQITELTNSSGNAEKIRELKAAFENIVVKTNLSERIINSLTDDTLKYLNQVSKDSENSLKESWIQPDVLPEAIRMLSNYSREYNDARNKIQLHNMRLVCRIAIDTKNVLAVLGFEKSDLVTDLVGAGIEGMMIAVEKFDYTRGNKFSTAATPVIRGAIKKFCYKQNIVQIDFADITKISKIRKATRELVQQLHRVPDNVEIANYLNTHEKQFIKKPISPREVEQLQEIKTTGVSIETPVGEFGDETVGSKQADPNAIIAGSATADIHRLRNKIQSIKQKLSAKENAAVERYFNLENLDVSKFYSQILATRRHFQRMKQQQFNDSFDSEINKFLSIYVEYTTTSPVNAISNVGKQAMTIDPTKMTGKADCPVSIAAYEMYNMSEGNKTPKQWTQLSDDERKNYVSLIQSKAKLSTKQSTNPAVTRPPASPNQQTLPSAKITSLGAI